MTETMFCKYYHLKLPLQKIPLWKRFCRAPTLLQQPKVCRATILWRR